MRKDLRVFSSIALMVAMLSSTVLSLAQERQPAPDRVMIERQRAEPGQNPPVHQVHDRVLIEQDAIRQGPQGGGDYVFLATEMSFGGKLVKGAPYSAQAVTESVQTLTDGNRIVNRSTASVYRDGEGRTRREQTLKSIGPYSTSGEPAVTVFINDPVAGASYTLDPRTQTARKMTPTSFRAFAKTPGDVKQGEAREGEVRYREQVSQMVLERSPSAGGDYKIAVDAAAVDARRNLEGGLAIGINTPRNRSARNESLGKQNINGVEAEGTRNTVTIAAGEIGNELPIQIVSERWYSPELQVIVMTKHTDPRFGENSYQLTNINRSEPSRDLFEVPAGYTMKETPAIPMTGQGGGINGGILNGKASSLPLPEYPAVARQAKASGTVAVQITIDEGGNVIVAEAVSGHPLLRAAAVKAARDAKFSPTRLSGQPVRVNGVLTYNFAAQ